MTMPQEELAQNVSRSLMRTLRCITSTRNDGQLDSLKTIKIEDEGITPMQFMKTYGTEWAKECDNAGILLVDSSGRRIPGDIPDLEGQLNMIINHEPKRVKGLIPKVKRVLRYAY